jgi:acyl-CoA thioesterase-1
MLVAVALFLVSAAPVAAWPTHILPLGDSITQGGRKDRKEYSYRYPLFKMLADEGYEFDFIGSMKTGVDKAFKWPDYKKKKFDADHEGHYGWKTRHIRDNLFRWMKTYRSAPDIVLMHLGTNDMNADDHDVAIIEPMTEIIGMLRKRNPEVVILIGHLNFRTGAAAEIRALVDKMAKRLSSATSPVVTVPMYRNWVESPHKKEADTYDWTHPNQRGQKKMAQQWFKAMLPYLKSRKSKSAK